MATHKLLLEETPPQHTQPLPPPWELKTGRNNTGGEVAVGRLNMLLGQMFSEAVNFKNYRASMHTCAENLRSFAWIMDLVLKGKTLGRQQADTHKRKPCSYSLYLKKRLHHIKYTEQSPPLFRYRKPNNFNQSVALRIVTEWVQTFIFVSHKSLPVTLQDFSADLASFRLSVKAHFYRVKQQDYNTSSDYRHKPLKG